MKRTHQQHIKIKDQHIVGNKSKLQKAVCALFIAGATALTAVYAFEVSPQALAQNLFGNAPEAVSETQNIEQTRKFSRSDDKKQANLASAALTNGTMTVARSGHTATRLNDGTILIAGGDSGTFEIFDPALNTASGFGSLTTPRTRHTATKLSDGRVFIAGGADANGAPLVSSEIYDPSTGILTSGATMNAPRAGHTATVLADGRILIAGGSANGSAEIYDAAADTFTSVDNALNDSRSGHSAVLMNDGRVFLTGGINASNEELNSAEIFNPSDSIFTAVGNAMGHHRSGALLRVLPDGKIQIIGGNQDLSMEVYDPAIDTIGAHAHLIPTNDEHDALLRIDILNAPTRAALFHHGQTDTLIDRENHSITELGNQAQVAGGANTAGQTLNTLSVLDSSSATVTTDKLDYQPGQTAVISGTGWQAGELVSLILHEDPHTHTERRLTATADAGGNFTANYLVEEHDLNITFIVGAKGQTSGRTAQTTFTDNKNFTIIFAGTGGGTITFSGVSPNPQPTTNLCTGTCINSLDNNATGTLTVTPNPGSVFTGWTGSFGGGGTTTCTGTATSCTFSLSNSAQTLTATFTGNTNTTTTVASSLNPSTFGQAVTFMATVARSTGSGAPTGTVQFKVDGSNLGSPVTLTSVNTTSSSATSAGTTTLAVGTRVITAEYSPGAGFNSSMGTLSGGQVVDKANQTITFGALAAKNYGDDPITVSATGGASGNVVTFTATGNCTSGGTNGATITITGAGSCTVTASQAGNTNYNAAPNVLQVFTINQKSLTPNITANNKVYDGNTSAAIATRTLTGSIVGTDDVSLTGGTATFDNKNAGTGKTVTATGLTLTGTAAGNYVLSSTTATTTANITPATLTVTADNQSREYGDANPTFTASYSGFVTGENLLTSGVAGAASCTTTATATSAASPPPYPIDCTVGTLSAANYSFSFVSGTLTITKANLTVTAPNASREYGTANPSFAPSYGTFKNGETAAALTTAPTCTSAATAASPASPPNYSIVCSGGVSGNYNFTYVDGALTITKATLTVTANNKSRTYGAADPTFDAAITGFKNGETLGTSGVTGSPSCSTSATAASPVGDHPITCAAGTLAAANYLFNFVNGTLTVERRAITVTADPQTKVYGDGDPALTYQVTGGSVVNGDSFTGALTRAPGDTVGNYAIQQGTLTLGDNYALTFAGANLAITKKSASVTPDAASKTYGAAEPTLAGALSGFLAGDGVTASYSRTAGETVAGSPYTISATLSPAGVLGNYVITYNTASFTINPATPTVNVTGGTFTFDGQPHPATATATGVASEAVTGTFAFTYTPPGDSTEPVNAGSYGVSVSFTSGNSNYANAVSSGTITIDQAASITDVSCPASVVYNGAPQTPCRVSVTGAGGLSLSPAANHTANVNVGTVTASYTFAGDANHTGSDDSATFDITKAPVTATAGSGSAVYDGSPKSPSDCVVSGAYTGDLTCVNNPATVGPNAGTTTINPVVNGSGLTNFQISDTPGSYTISKAPTTTVVTFEAAPYIYRGTAYTATATVSGAGGLSEPVSVIFSGDCTNVTVTNGCTATATYAESANHLGSNDSESITISKANATITVNGYTGVYDGLAHGATGSAVGVLNEPLAGLTLGATFTNVPGGTAEWSFTDVTGNYNNASGTAAIAISKANANITVTPYSVVYDGNPHTATGTAIGVESPTPADLSGLLDLSGTTHTDAGTYTGDAWTFAGNGNYNFAAGTVDNVITRALSTTTIICPTNITYTGEALTPCSATVTGVGGLNESLTVSYSNNVNAGTANANASYAGGTNHEGSSDSKTFTIDQANSVTDVSCPPSVVYNGAPQTPCIVSVTGAGGLSLTPNADYTNNTVVGTATASYNFAGDANHTSSDDSATFDITKAPVTATAGGGTTIYDGAAKTPSACIVSGVYTGDLSCVNTPASVGPNAGTTAISPVVSGSGLINFEITSVNGSYTINKAPTTTVVTFESGPYVYRAGAFTATAQVTGANGLNSVLTVSYTGDCRNVTVSNGCTAAATYAESANHLGSTDSKSITITPKSATWTTNNNSKIFGASDPNPLTTGTGSGFFAVDSVTAAYSRTAGEAVGGYPITATLSSVNPLANYAVTNTGATFTIGAWTLNGFYQPVGIPNTYSIPAPTSFVWNTIRGGQTVPLKFNVFAGSIEQTATGIISFTSQEIQCTTYATLEDPVEIVTTGGTVLRYSGTSGVDGQYIQNWQTPSSPNRCFRVRMTTADGSSLYAFFKTKK